MNIEDAVGQHAAWKTKFRTAISKKEKLDYTTISRDDCCDLGKWLSAEGKQKYQAVPQFKECVSKHSRFHQEAGKVAKLINEGKFAQAEAALAAGTDYSNASSEVGVAIGRLKKEIANRA